MGSAPFLDCSATLDLRPGWGSPEIGCRFERLTPARQGPSENNASSLPLLRRGNCSPELASPDWSSPKSCVKSLCSSFFLIRVLLCQARLAGPSVSVGIKNRFLPKPSVQLLSSPYDRISCFHQECPTILFPVLMDIHQNCANQAFC